jgi:pyridoxal 5'-phosphate synthase pdxT subunit
VKIGILALQGAVEPHAEKLGALGAEVVYVRTPADLVGLSGIVLPGGESSTMVHVLGLNKLWEPLATFVKEKPALGVCAGAILLAEEVSHPKQKSLAALPIAVERNSYGRQLASFIAPLESTNGWRGPALEGIFIRAPRIVRTWGETRVLMRYRSDIVLVECGKTLAATFHPELTSQTAIHDYFLQKCSGN